MKSWRVLFPGKPWRTGGMLPWCAALVAGLCVSAFAGMMHAGEPEKLISAGWGRGAGKFGIVDMPAVEREGPVSFTVDEKGFVYILDAVKSDVKIFRSDGSFAGRIQKNIPGYSLAAMKGDLLVLNGDSVYRYSISGRLLETYPLSAELELEEGYGQWIRVDDLGNVYVKGVTATYQVCRLADGRITGLSSDEQVRSGRRGTPGRSGDRWYVFKKKSKRHMDLVITDLSGRELGTVPIESRDAIVAAALVGEDARGGIHVELNRITGEDDVRLDVRRYSPQGELMSSIEIIDSSYTTVYKKLEVDREGNVYQLITSQHGVEVVKWNLR